jgi:hypothetical protein
MFSREKWLRVIDAVADFVLNPRHCASPDDMRRQTAAERRLAKEEAQNRAAQVSHRYFLFSPARQEPFYAAFEILAGVNPAWLTKKNMLSMCSVTFNG